MRSLRKSLGVLLPIALLSLTSVAIAAPKAPAAIGVGDAKDSGTISKQVQHKLAMLVWYGVFDHLTYQVNGTEVVLSGQLISEHAQTESEAVNALKRIPGVTNVVDHVEVLPVSMNDDRIRRAEYRSIFSKSDLGRYTMGSIPQLHIVVKGGHVDLEGIVINQMDKTVAGMAANGVSGVFSVTNNLQIG